MTENIEKTALVTGANSGLGFSAAAQLASSGWSRVILACRTLEKAQDARARLVEQTGVDPFEELALDVSDNDGVTEAVADLARRGGAIDFLLLNAGLVSGKEPKHSKDGIELTMAASLVGHHVLTMGLLDEQLLSDDAHIVIAGSEAARGDVPMFGLTDIVEYAAEHYDGDRARAVAAIARVEAPYRFAHMSHYGTVKLFVAHWAAALSRRLPNDIMVNAVSPGSAPATNAMRNQSGIFRFMISAMLPVAGLFGMAAPVPKAARRYLDALDYDASSNGGFFASVPGKMTGAVVEQTQAHVLDEESQEATWRAVLELSGAVSDVLSAPKAA